MKIKLEITALACLLALSSATAETRHRYRVQDVPNVQLQDYTRYVSDPENILEIKDITLLDEKAAELRDSLDLQTSIVVLPHIDNEEYGSARDFANQLFNTWGIGDKETNRGLLILLLTAEGEREIVFETGYGTEETLTDGLCQLIQTKKMLPFLKEGEYGKGLIAGVEEIEKVFKGSSELLLKDPLMSQEVWIVIIWIVGGLIIVLIVEKIRKKRIVTSENQYVSAAKYDSLSGIGCVMAILFFPSYLIFMIYKEIAKKSDIPKLNCEKCHAKGTVILRNEPQVVQKAIPGQNGLKHYHFICKACNYEHKELVSYEYEKPQSKSGSSSSSTYRKSGGSTWGGSWGGGSSGGGGSSTKF